MVNHYYFYILDREWGSLIKTCGYAPFGVCLYLNGHEWAKRQAARAGIGFTPRARRWGSPRLALDNGFAG
jgi:hypothetical protein